MARNLPSIDDMLPFALAMLAMAGPFMET